MFKAPDFKKIFNISDQAVIRFSISWDEDFEQEFIMLHSTFQETLDRVNEFMRLVLLNDSFSPRFEIVGEEANNVSLLSAKALNALDLIYMSMSHVAAGDNFILEKHPCPTLNSVHVPNDEPDARSYPDVIFHDLIDDPDGLSMIDVDDITPDTDLEDRLLQDFYGALFDNTAVWLRREYGFKMEALSFRLFIRVMYRYYMQDLELSYRKKDMGESVIITKAPLIDRIAAHCKDFIHTADDGVIPFVGFHFITLPEDNESFVENFRKYLTNISKHTDFIDEPIEFVKNHCLFIVVFHEGI